MKTQRRKGNSSEVDVCRWLSAWVNGERKVQTHVPMRDLPVRRRTTSVMPVEGHWDGAGDLVVRPGLYFPFACEVKNRGRWELDGVISGGPDWTVWEWWAQCCEQAAKVKRYPLMLFRRNRREWLAMLPESVAICLNVFPKNRPLLRVERPDGQRVVVCWIGDLIATDLKRLARASLSGGSERSRSREARTSVTGMSRSSSTLCARLCARRSSTTKRSS